MGPSVAFVPVDAQNLNSDFSISKSLSDQQNPSSNSNSTFANAKTDAPFDQQDQSNPSSPAKTNHVFRSKLPDILISYHISIHHPQKIPLANVHGHYHLSSPSPPQRQGHCHNDRHWRRQVPPLRRPRHPLSLLRNYQFQQDASLQGLDITTNKIPFDERKNVPHHLLGEVDPVHGDLSPAEFRSKAGPVIADICSRMKLPIIVVGSNSFIHALLIEKLDP